MSEALRAALEAGEVARALDELASLEPSRRKQALDLALERCKVWCVGDWVERGGSHSFVYAGTDEQRAAVSLAALVLAEPEELIARLKAAKAARVYFHHEALPVLERFRPRWLEAGGAEALFEAGLFSFELMMDLRERGMIPQPRGEGYAVSLIAAPRRFYGGLSFLEVLDQHPRFKAEDLRLIFSVEGTSENNLAALDKYGDNWSPILHTLLARGELSRAELLDTTLEVLSRGYPAFRAGWYSRFHEALTPTLEERAQRQPGYERLLGSAVPQTASFALKALEVLQKKGRLETPGLLDTIEPVLSAAHAETVKRALKMLTVVAKATPSERERIAELSLVALVHADAAVQAAAVALFLEAGGRALPDLVARLQQLAQGLAPSVQNELNHGLFASALEPPTATATWPALGSSRTTPNDGASDVWRRPAPYAAERAVSPPQTLESALSCLSQAIEHPQDPELFELALDAASRFAGAERSALNRLGGPLRKRALQLVKRGPTAEALQLELVRIALGWLAGEHYRHPHAELEQPGRVPQFVWRRTDALITRLLRQQSGPLLSAPTHQHGHLAEAELARRLQAHDGPIDVEDAALALLRVAQPAAERLITELSQRVDQHAAAALTAAAGVFAPERARPRVLRWGTEYVWHRVIVDVEPAPQATDRAALPELLLYELVQERGVYGFEPWLPLALPRASEWVAAAEALHHGGYDFDQAARSGELRCWRDPSVEPGPNMYMALAIALGTRSLTISLSARDTLIAEIESARLCPERLGAAFAALLPSGLIKVGRWSQHLQEVAAVSPAHARSVWRAMLASLRGEAASYPRESNKLLGLMKELRIQLQASCDDPEARAWLASVKSGGQLGKHAAALLS